MIGESTSITPYSVLTLRPAPPLGALQFYVSEGRGRMEEISIYLC